MSRDLIESLSDPSAYAHPCATVDVLQTHISVLFFSGDFVYKVKKSVDLGFLDYTSLESRHHFCLEEVRLNSRLAPDIYLGVSNVTEGPNGRLEMDGPGKVVDHAVRMRRLPADRMMDARLDRGEIDNSLINELVDLLIRFHGNSATGPNVDRHGAPDAVERNILGAFPDEAVLSPAIDRILRGRVDDQFVDLGELMRRRVSEGRIREGHGDLHTGNICLTDDGIVIYDCIEFCDEFRCQDVVSEIAFLAMDLDYRGYRGFSGYLARCYADRTGDNGFLNLLDFYKFYRAMVRGKVAGIRSRDDGIDDSGREASRQESLRYFQLAASYHVPPFIVLMCGLPGSGKSWLARRLAAPFEAQVTRTDVVRKQLAGLPPRERGGSELYTKKFSDRTYRRTLEIVEETLDHDRPVIVDAGFFTASRRAPFVEVSRIRDIPLIVVHVTCDDGTVRERMSARAVDPTEVSDADMDVHDRVRISFEPPAECPTVLEHTSGAPVDPLATRLLETLLSPDRGGSAPV